ncbi:hypothetical protein PYCC9005_002978 [Savitreella phatthalungensis]
MPMEPRFERPVFGSACNLHAQSGNNSQLGQEPQQPQQPICSARALCRPPRRESLHRLLSKDLNNIDIDDLYDEFDEDEDDDFLLTRRHLHLHTGNAAYLRASSRRPLGRSNSLKLLGLEERQQYSFNEFLILEEHAAADLQKLARLSQRQLSRDSHSSGDIHSGTSGSFYEISEQARTRPQIKRFESAPWEVSPTDSDIIERLGIASLRGSIDSSGRATPQSAPADMTSFSRKPLGDLSINRRPPTTTGKPQKQSSQKSGKFARSSFMAVVRRISSTFSSSSNGSSGLKDRRTAASTSRVSLDSDMGDDLPLALSNDISNDISRADSPFDVLPVKRINLAKSCAAKATPGNNAGGVSFSPSTLDRLDTAAIASSVNTRPIATASDAFTLAPPLARATPSIDSPIAAPPTATAHTASVPPPAMPASSTAPRSLRRDPSRRRGGKDMTTIANKRKTIIEMERAFNFGDVDPRVTRLGFDVGIDDDDGFSTDDENDGASSSRSTSSLYTTTTPRTPMFTSAPGSNGFGDVGHAKMRPSPSVPQIADLAGFLNLSSAAMHPVPPLPPSVTAGTSTTTAYRMSRMFDHL